MRGKIALEEHVSTPENNRLWDSSGEAGRNGTEYMKDVERRLLDRSIQLEEMAQRHIDHVILSLTSPGAQSILDKAKAVSFARDTNDFIVENYVKPNPDKFSAFATGIAEPGSRGGRAGARREKVRHERCADQRLHQR